tara:strand:+ start:66 stop:308 length:243 start_codon:yes stop_codon:yes gene_type:complete
MNKNLGEKMRKCKCYMCNKELQKKYKNFSVWINQLDDPLDAICDNTFDMQLIKLQRKYNVKGKFIYNFDLLHKKDLEWVS